MNHITTFSMTSFSPLNDVLQIGPDRWLAVLPGTGRAFIGRSKAEAVGALILCIAEEMIAKQEGGAK